jgi:hypothetical protein
MKVVILGTGSTIGTLERVALATELGVNGFTRRLSRVKPEWRNEYPSLARAVDDSGSENLDQIWTRMDYAGKLQRSLKRPTYPPETSGQLHRALLVAYSLADEVERLDLDSCFTLKTALMDLGDGDVLISFNWDTVAERIARSPSLGKKLVASGPVLHGRSVNLVKPHGSLSWEDGGTPESVKWRDDHGEPLLTPMPVERVHHGEYMQPLVLGAVPMKERLIKETQPNQTIYEVFADQWAAVVDAITGATALTVIGYRFPSEDGYGRFLLREAARRRRQPLPQIPYYALERDRAAVEQALREVFGDDARCSFKGPVDPASPKP